MRDYDKDLEGLAYWMIPAVIWWDAMIVTVRAMVIAHAYLHGERK